MESAKARLVEIEKTINTASILPKEEKALTKEKKRLEDSLPHVEKYESIQPEKSSLLAQKKKFAKESSAIWKDLDYYNDALDEMNEGWKMALALNPELLQDLTQLEEKSQEVWKRIEELKASKEEEKENYFKGLYEFEMQKRENKHIEWMKRQLERVKQDNEWKIKWEEEAELRRQAEPNPYEDEISNCEYLAGYLRKIKSETERKKKEADQAEINKVTSEVNLEEIKQKEAQGQIQIYKKKEEEVVVGKRGKKNKGKKKKNQEVKKVAVVTDSNEVNLNLDV